MNSQILKARTKQFAHECVRLVSTFPKTKPVGPIITRQLIRSSTSVAANYRAACLAATRPLFNSKLDIVVEEIDESVFWIEFARDEQLIQEEQFGAVLDEGQQLARIFISSRMTARGRHKPQS